MSVQYAAVASQKFTCPVVTKGVPAFTVAVNVTTLPEATVVTTLPPEVAARVVTVAAIVCAPAPFHAPQIITAGTQHNPTIELRKLERLKIR
jgi:hypothetical protein